jgi:predicted transcriptional regulator
MKKPATKPKPKQEKIIFSVRLDMKERDALEKAANAEERPAAVVVRRLIRDFLKAGQWIK